MFKRLILASFCAATLFVTSGSSQVSAQTIRQIDQTIAQYRTLQRQACGRRGYEQVCAGARRALNYFIALRRSRTGGNSNSNNGNNSNQGSSVQQQIRRNSINSRNYALSKLNRRVRQGFYIRYQILGTNYRGERLWYHPARWTLVRPYQARRTIYRITNNGGRILQVVPN